MSHLKSTDGTHPPTSHCLCSMALQDVSNTWGQDASSLRTFVGKGFTVLPRNSYIFNLPILEIAHKWIACYLMSSSLKSLGCLGLIMHSKVSLCEPERTVITACYHRGATMVSIICPYTHLLSLKSFLFSDVPLHSDQGDISRSARKPFRNGNCLGCLIGVFDQYSTGLW